MQHSLTNHSKEKVSSQPIKLHDLAHVAFPTPITHYVYCELTKHPNVASDCESPKIDRLWCHPLDRKFTF